MKQATGIKKAPAAKKKPVAKKRRLPEKGGFARRQLIRVAKKKAAKRN
jgi:hypothetical protein